jgi:phage protein D
MTQLVTVPEAARSFADFYVPRFEISASGRSLDAGVVRDVLQVSYNDSTTEIDSFDVTVNNWDPERREFKYVGAEESVLGDTATQRLFNPGVGEFELKLGYGSELATMMRGSTTSLEPSFPASGASTLTVRALNALHQLRSRQHRDRWPNSRVSAGNVKMSKIAKDIGERRNEGGCHFPLPIRTSDRALGREAVLDSITQDNQYDIDFLLIQARKLGYVVYVDQEPQGRSTREVLYFGPPDDRHPGVPDLRYELKWGISLIDFSPKLSTANQVSGVEVRSWNRSTNRAIKPRVTTSDSDLRRYGITANTDLLPLVQRRDTMGLPLGTCREREEVIVNEPQFTLQQAERRAASMLSERLQHMVEATGTTIGLPNLRAGQRVVIEGVGRRFRGVYFVTRTTHTINDSGYTTKFSAHRESALPRDGGPS